MDILISGAGVAGLATASNLGRQGHRITVVERAPHFRLKGTPIDIRGDAGITTWLRDLKRAAE